MSLTAIEKWEDKQLTGSIQLFQTSTNQVWNVYLYLEDGDSLIILEDGMSCPVYNQHSDWLKNLQSLVEIKDYLFDKKQLRKFLAALTSQSTLFCKINLFGNPFD